MTTRPQSGGPQNATQDVANLGLVRPPLVYLVSLVSGALIQLATPLPFLPGTLAVPLGAPLVVVAIALFSYSVAKFRAAGTPVPARKPTTVIVQTGPYRYSRNPIYLSFPARRRIVGQQSLATRHPHASGGADVVRGHSARGAISGDSLPVGLLALQGFCASLAVSGRRTRA